MYFGVFEDPATGTEFNGAAWKKFSGDADGMSITYAHLWD